MTIAFFDSGLSKKAIVMLIIKKLCYQFDRCCNRSIIYSELTVVLKVHSIDRVELRNYTVIWIMRISLLTNLLSQGQHESLSCHRDFRSLIPADLLRIAIFAGFVLGATPGSGSDRNL